MKGGGKSEDGIDIETRSSLVAIGELAHGISIAIITIVAQEIDKNLRSIWCGVDKVTFFDSEGRTVASEEGADEGTKHVYSYILAN